MKVPLSWIKEYLDIQLSPEDIAQKLTMAGIEVDAYETLGSNFEGVVVGRVVSVEKHPNADKLCVAQVTDGQDTYQVVCGAANCRAGLKTAFAREGAILKDEEGKEFKIKKTKLRGVESLGMLCAADELGLAEQAEGIMELSESLPEGKLLADIYSDTIFDVSLTPNLGHCLSIVGIVRELSAATGLPIRYPQIKFKEEASLLMEQQANVTVLDQKACPRYVCRVIKGIKIGPSPEWLRLRLEKCGTRSINNIVDATNYVLLEMGHPLHAFDYDYLENGHLIVKRAQDGTLFKTLDGKDRLLTREDLLICDEKGPLAIAGVMGGEESEVKDHTTNILIESAYFDAVCVRKTSKQLGLQTEASKRYERGTDPNNLIPAVERVVMLIQEIAGGQVASGWVDVKEQEVFPEKIIDCRLSRINQLLGTVLGRGEVETVFQRLNFFCQWDGRNTFSVKVPTYRVDIQSEIDLIEEVARIYGYDNIPKQSTYYQSSHIPHAPMYTFERDVYSRLIAEGLQEFLTCDLIGPSILSIVGDDSMPEEAIIKVLNPSSIEQSVLRTSLLPGLLQVVKHNIDHQVHNISGFEMGRIHFKEGDHYKEQSVFGIILTGDSQPRNWSEKPRSYDFFDLKGIVENILNELGIKNPVYKNLGLNTFHSGRQASLFVDALEIGSIGEIHPAILRRLDVSQRILFAEFNMQDLMQVIKRQEKIKDLPLYPGSERDWTLTLEESFSMDQLIERIKKAQTDLLQELEVLGIYRSDKLGKERKNVTLRFVYRDPQKTLAQETVDSEHQRLMSEVVKSLGEAIKA